MAGYLSEKELEEIADQVFQDYAKLPAAWDQGMMLRVKPELLLNDLLDLKILCRTVKVVLTREGSE